VETIVKLIQIDFQLLGTEVSPAKISEMTGIIPDIEMLRGARNKKLDLPRQNIWAIKSKSDSDEVADHWNSLSPILQSARSVFKEVSVVGVAKFTLIVNSGERIPSIIIPASMSEFAGSIGAVIDIDHIQY
jgi:hypothetical protein